MNNTNLNIYRDVNYRPDIQGIRAIGAILIMVYHIWFQKVSGGVDVFFVVSGYFMAGMLLRQYLTHESIKPIHFWGRIIARIAPLTYIVILFTILAGYFFLPPHLWRMSINDVLTSALFIENWQLIRVGADYLNSGEAPSPLQQFWALSLQVQLYFILPFVFIVGLTVSRKSGLNNPMPLMVIVALIIVTSFIYSLAYTNNNPSAAYFNTFARSWEFFVGVFLFLTIPFIKVSAGWGRMASVLGIFGIVLVGVLVPETANFPGYIALLPVAAAVLMIVSGGSIEVRKGVVGKILSSKSLVYIGGISFSLYLWHWPIFIYFQHYNGVASNPSLAQGLMIIASAFLLSILTKLILETPLSKVTKGRVFAPYAVGVALFIPIFAGTYLLRGELVRASDLAESTDFVQGFYYEGNGVFIQEDRVDISLERMIAIKRDLTGASFKECITEGSAGEISSCEFGDTTQEKSVLLVGGSRLAHWEPFFSYLGNKHGFKVITAAINACSFGYDPTRGGDINCQNWNDNIIDFIASISPAPEVVIANSSRQREGSDFVPQGYLESWSEVIALGIPVVGLRVPMQYEEPNSCLWKNLENPSICAVDKHASLSTDNPADKYQAELDGFHSVDFSSVLCDGGMCPVVFNGYPAMRDNEHFTKSYIVYMSKSLEDSLNTQLGNLFY